MHKLLHHAIEMFAMKGIYGEINFLEVDLYPECIISAGISAKLAEQRKFWLCADIEAYNFLHG